MGWPENGYASRTPVDRGARRAPLVEVKGIRDCDATTAAMVAKGVTERIGGHDANAVAQRLASS